MAEGDLARGATVDTSSYKLPTAPSALDTLGKLQGLKQQDQAIQQGQINIDKSKLELAYKGMDYLTQEINSLPPTATPQDIFRVFQNGVNQKFLTPEVYQQAIKEVPTSQNEMQAFKDRYIARAQQARAALEYYVGTPGVMDDGQRLNPIRTSPRPGMGIVQGEGLPVQRQVPPTAQVTGEDGQPQFLGPQAPQLAPGTTGRPGERINTGPLPVGIRRMPDGSVIETGPNTAAPVNNRGLPVAPAGSPAAQVADRFPMVPRGPVTGLPPGEGEASVIAGQASGTQLAKDRAASANFQRDVFPLREAIPALEKLGTKGTGPGTETINNLKSFVLSNVPGIKESDFNGTVADYDKAKKYLTDFVNQTGNSGTNDKLAAAFAGNPSVSISNAAAVDVAKSALALRRMQQATIQEFERLGKKPSDYSRWLAKRSNEIDPRAFGVDLMSDEAKAKLRAQLDRNPVERKRFEESGKLARNYL